ncbi:MAG: hypothetical protein AAB539_04250 [Patescibacteria group bacterium]
MRTSENANYPHSSGTGTEMPFPFWVSWPELMHISGDREPVKI